MDGHAELVAAYLAAVEAHKTHRPRLYRGRDGLWRCPACSPPSMRDWLANLAWRWRRRR